MPTSISLRTFEPSEIAAVDQLQQAYARLRPGAQVVPGEAYLSPGFAQGRNVWCAFDASGRLLGYAPLYPVLMPEDSGLPHTLWAEVRAHPELPLTAQLEIKDLLFDRLMQQAQAVTAQFPGHPAQLTFEYEASDTASSEYVCSRGCRYIESVYQMRRDLTLPIRPVTGPAGIDIRTWRMESQVEQQAYVAARNQCFPEAPTALEEWQYFMQSPQWSVGTSLAAFDGEQLVGNVAVFWDAAENQRTGRSVGYTEYIFVLPAWRGRNLARALITGGLLHLREHGLSEAHLGVRAANSNALKLYTDLGYSVSAESRFYGMSLAG